MKKIKHTLIFLLMSVSCKNRQVATIKNQTNDKSIITITKHNTTVLIDTGKITSEVMTSKTTKDWAEIIITPDTGTVQIINIAANDRFNYSGKAKQIIYKAGATGQNLSTKMSSQQNALTTRQNSLDSTVYKKNITQNTKSKTVNTKINSRLWITMIALLLLILVLIYYIKIKHPLI